MTNTIEKWMALSVASKKLLEAEREVALAVKALHLKKLDEINIAAMDLEDTVAVFDQRVDIEIEKLKG